MDRFVRYLSQLPDYFLFYDFYDFYDFQTRENCFNKVSFPSIFLHFYDFVFLRAHPFPAALFAQIQFMVVYT